MGEGFKEVNSHGVYIGAINYIRIVILYRNHFWLIFQYL